MDPRVFAVGHATHPDWRMAFELALPGALAQVGARRPRGPGFLYVTLPLAPSLGRIVERLREVTGVQDWVGAAAHGICATGAEYHGEPALAFMLTDLPPGSWHAFRDAPDHPRRDAAATLWLAQTVDAQTTEELERWRRASGPVFGGVAGEPGGIAALHVGGGPTDGYAGLSFLESVRIDARVTHTCSALGLTRTVTDSHSNFIRQLDGRPALDVLLDDLGVTLEEQARHDGEAILRALPAARLRAGLFIGLASEPGCDAPGLSGFSMRNVVGIDPRQGIIAIAARATVGTRAVFCTREREGARRDLVRTCTQLRGTLEDERRAARGLLYHSCAARGPHLFGSAGAEVALLEHNLGRIPMVGMFGGGEIWGSTLHSHTGVLAVFS